MFSDNLKQYRLQSRLTQAQAASALGITRVSYTRYELGTQTPHITLLPAIAKLYGCRIDDLFDDGDKDAKASAQTLLNAQQIETRQGDDTPPWDAPARDLDDILE